MMSDIEPGPGESLVNADEIDTSGIKLEDETPTAPRAPRALLDEKEAINQEIVKALRENLPNPVFPVLVVRIFNFGGALYDAGLDAKMPPSHRLLIGGAALVAVIGATNPDVLDKIAAKWKNLMKSRAPAAAPQVQAPVSQEVVEDAAA